MHTAMSHALNEKMMGDSSQFYQTTVKSGWPPTHQGFVWKQLRIAVAIIVLFLTVRIGTSLLISLYGYCISFYGGCFIHLLYFFFKGCQDEYLART
jgi:hypothetical protein